MSGVTRSFVKLELVAAEGKGEARLCGMKAGRMTRADNTKCFLLIERMSWAQSMGMLRAMDRGVESRLLLSMKVKVFGGKAGDAGEKTSRLSAKPLVESQHK